MIKWILFILLTINSFAGIGNILVLKGVAEIHRSHDILPAKIGMSIENGDRIVTQKQTKTQVILHDDTIITIGSNSSFKFDNFFFDGSKKSTLHMSTSRGFFRAVTGKIGKVAPERFKVNTSSATIGIRGTDFSVKIENALEHFRCYSGSIKITFGNSYKNLHAGESFELNLHTLRQWTGHLDTQLGKKEHIGHSGHIDAADLTGIEEFDREVTYPKPTPITPPGVLCETNLF